MADSRFGPSGIRRTSLQQVIGLNDVLQTWNWDLIFPNIPRVVDTRSFTVRALDTSIPNSDLEVVAVDTRILKLNFAGRRTYGGTWSATFLETRDAATRDMLIGWQEFARSYRQNSGSYKSEYAVPADLILYDDKPKAVRAVRMHNLWPSSVAEVTLNTAAEAIKYATTFTFDWYDEIDPVTGDILNNNGLAQLEY